MTPVGPRLLFVSNGHGEDLIAGEIINRLSDLATTAYPLVGLGVYPPGIPLLDPRRAMPSGGFSLRAGLRGLRADLSAGLLSLWLDQRRTLLAQRGRWPLVVAVGDVYCLWMSGQVRTRTAFVATADSVRTGGFGTRAHRAMRRYAAHVFARDEDTAAALREAGIAASAPGNVMVDQIRVRGETFGFAAETPVVTLLPGSRQDAPDNAALLAQVSAAVASLAPDTRFLLAVAPTVSEPTVRDRLARAGATTAANGDLAMGGSVIRLTPEFGDAAAMAWVVCGMAGTAHEQAAALGRSVVAFPGTGAQFGPQFLAGQARLLGDALVPARDWREAAGAIVRLLRDPDERRRRETIGRERMGPPGGAQRIADALRMMVASGDGRAAEPAAESSG